ncbi:MAG TPA: TonB-dependent receptor [Terracidiphilus sp.]
MLLLFASFQTLCRGEGTSSSASSNSLKGLSLQQLGEVEVTTYSKVPSEMWRTPAAIYVITGDQILRSGATTIADALRLAPGVEVGRLSSDTWAVGIRGLQNNFSKSVLVLIDGRNVYTPLFAGVYWDVQDMPLTDIDRIEVIRGPGGTIWGANAANGVINIITKNSSDTKGVLADGLAGTQSHTIDDLEIGGGSPRLSYRVFGRGFQRRHEYHSDGINDDSWHQERLGFRVDGIAGPDDYFVEGNIYKGTSPHIVGTAVSNDITSGGYINARWQHDLSTEKGFYLQAYFDRTLRTHAAQVGESRDTIDIDYIQHFRLGASNLISWGGGLHWSPYLTIPAGLLEPPGGTDYEHTGFVQDEIRLRDHWHLTAGTKLEWNNYSGFDLQPSARILWSPGEKQSLWGGVSRAVTTPSDLEENFRLQAASATTVLQVLGNHSFKSEDVIGYEVGYRRLLGKKVFASLASFRNEYSRLQSFSAPMVSVSGGLVYITIQYQNQISGSASGAEAALESQITPWWRLNTNYSYMNSDFASNGPTSSISSTGTPQTYDGSSPKHMVTAESMFDLPGHIQFDQTYRYISALPAEKVNAYQTMDLHLQKSLGRDFALELVGQNLFQNVHDEWGTGDPTQPVVGMYREGYVRLTFSTGQKTAK